MDLKIIFEDEKILVVNKPTGLIVNKSHTAPVNTLQQMLSNYIDVSRFGDENSDFVNRNGIVHRLDKDTSGVLLVAKNPDTFSNLQAQFKNRKVKKEYIALVFDKINNDKIHIDAPIARDPKNRVRFTISQSGKESITKIKLLNTLQINDKWLSLVNVQPLTGRTHQIRIHMLAINHPVVGDFIYSGKGRLAWAKEHGFDRLMLHAHKIGILYPNNEYTWYETELPKQFHDFV